MHRLMENGPFSQRRHRTTNTGVAHSTIYGSDPFKGWLLLGPSDTGCWSRLSIYWIIYLLLGDKMVKAEQMVHAAMTVAFP